MLLMISAHSSSVCASCGIAAIVAAMSSFQKVLFSSATTESIVFVGWLSSYATA